MKGMKGKFLKKLKSISTITTLRQGLLFQFNSPNQYFQTPPVFTETELKNNSLPEGVPDSVSVSEVLNDVKDEEMDSGSHIDNTENFRPPRRSKESVPAQENEEMGITIVSTTTNACTVSLPDQVQLLTHSQTLDPIVDADISAFDPLSPNAKRPMNPKSPAFFEPRIMEDSTINEVEEDTKEFPSILDFEEKCPPGGSESVILYTTSMRGIRKTFEDCNSIRFLLESFRVLYYERDVSMHMEFREELWRILGGRVVPPRLFIKGRHVGGVDEVVGLHEQGKLLRLLQGIPINSSNSPCCGCSGVRFVLCFNCNGSRKIAPEGQDSELPNRCLECNENGLIKCPICC